MNNYFSTIAPCTNDSFLLIAGPCVIEDYETTFETASHLKTVCEALGIPFVFKSSFDKANRSSVDAFRGPGFERGLEILARIKKELGVKVISDIHSPEQAAPAAKVLDILQIPAFLCRQTDLISAAAATGKPLNIKKGQFLAPLECSNIIKKAKAAGCNQVSITERGTTFGYNNLVVDFRAIDIVRGLGVPVVFDATHSVQLPGGAGSSSAGERKFAPTLARAAIAAGADGLFIETHPDPDKALCDGPNSLPLAQMKPFLETLLAIRKAVGPIL
ncbi:MAG: 3-deoxy-8-phosphooctulonate synthase [Desulfobacterium sp.]|nr:3-deoxy-8-phosphooctulonate synthase [Desulfobacterium sp.]